MVELALQSEIGMITIKRNTRRHQEDDKNNAIEIEK
jgi:hypothetical protein